MNHLLLLQCLLFMSFGEHMFVDHGTPNCSAVNTGSLIGRCNRVCSADAITDDDIKSIQAYFGKIPFTWVVDADQKATIQLLEKHGLRYKVSVPGMAVDLELIKDSGTSDRITVKKITEDQDFLVWISIVCANYGYNKDELTKAIHFLRARASPETLKLYIGYYEGKAAAASMALYHHNEIVSVHFVGTLMEYRGRGLGCAMIGKPLLHARNQGYKSSVLMSSEMGFPLAQKLGFTQYRMYVIYGNY